jgi:hypothetical protein
MGNPITSLPELAALDGYGPSQALGANIPSASPVVDSSASLSSGSPVANSGSNPLDPVSAFNNASGAVGRTVGNAATAVLGSIFNINSQAIVVIIGLILIAGGVFIFGVQGIFGSNVGSQIREHGRRVAGAAVRDAIL